jgi:hypothetical protein
MNEGGPSSLLRHELLVVLFGTPLLQVLIQPNFPCEFRNAGSVCLRALPQGLSPCGAQPPDRPWGPTSLTSNSCRGHFLVGEAVEV